MRNLEAPTTAEVGGWQQLRSQRWDLIASDPGSCQVPAEEPRLQEVGSLGTELAFCLRLPPCTVSSCSKRARTASISQLPAFPPSREPVLLFFALLLPPSPPSGVLSLFAPCQLPCPDSKMVIFDNHEYLTEEEKRLKEDRDRVKYWKKFGPYVAERQWATGMSRDSRSYRRPRGRADLICRSEGGLQRRRRCLEP